MGVLDTSLEQATLACFPLCRLMNGPGCLQFELGPLSLPHLLSPLPRMGSSSSAALSVHEDIMEQYKAGPTHSQELGGVGSSQHQMPRPLLSWVL